MDEPAKPHLSAHEILQSPVVANRTMNRERSLQGAGGYERELRFEIVEHLRACGKQRTAKWVDLCCGSGQALVEAAALLRNSDARVEIEGIDLVGMFVDAPADPMLRLHVASIEQWTPVGPYDLITCVHGLHYVADKLGAIAKAVGQLAQGGVFVANQDLANIRFEDGQPAARLMGQALRSAGLEYDARHRILRCDGPRRFEPPWSFMGADDKAGPNYTGQPAVHSLYRRA